MFGEVINPTIKIGAKKWYTVPLSIIIHTVILGAVVIIPLMAVGAVPTPSGMAAFVAAPPPPPPPPPPPVRVGGQIKAPVRVKNVNPVYPSIAQSARVQGVVIIEATIGPDGRVPDTKVLRSIPLLDAAAVDAVKQW